ncbi:MAG: TRAP transporter small permease [Afipia sp.]
MTVRSILHRLEEGILAVLLCAMTVLTFTQVVMRYGFNSGWLWALEANFYLFGWLVLIGISYGVRVKAHIGVDAVVRLFPAPVQRAIGILVVGLALLYTGLMLYGSYEYISRLHIMGVEAEDIPVERWILSLCLPIGFALLFYRLLEMAWRIVTGRSPGYELADEARDAIRDIAGDENPDATVVSR